MSRCKRLPYNLGTHPDELIIDLGRISYSIFPEHFARATPDHPALSCNCDQISYQALNVRSNQLAQALLAHGAHAGDRIGIYMYKCLDLGSAIYGILKSGCAFVPLDPFMPVDRLSFILDDCQIKHIVSSDELIEPLDSLGTERALCIYGVDGDLPHQTLSWADIQHYPDHKPPLSIIDQALAYIMYTSGSTGMPKGMMHTHLGSITYARWGREHVDLTAADRVASHAPLHFDLSIFDFFSTAQAGATVVLVPEAVTRFPASWTKNIEEEKISVVFTVPYTLITMQEKGAMEKRNLSSLRWIMFGGEPYPPVKLRQLMLALPDVSFTNVYGPAEAPSCTCYNVPLPEAGDSEPIPIGTVSRNSEDIIIDENDEDCTPGQAGELCIRSTTLTRGYWNRPDLNEKAYLLREGLGPFPMVYFRTGDRVVRHADGNLRFLGRVDRMVKTRGHRVELDEVEAVLAAHPAVFEAAAYAVPDEADSLLIMAAVHLRADATADTTELFRHLRAALPAYAVPRDIQHLPELPHTSSGKIDRQKLTKRWQSNSRP